MTVPFAFANLSGNIALSKLDSNFNTPITIGNTSVLLGNTVTTLNNLTLANVTITSGTSNVTNVNVTNVTVTNLTATLANVTTLNVASAFITSANIGTLALTNALPVSSGGTGQVTFPANSVLLGNGTGGIATVAPGNVGNVLTSIGGVWVSNVALSGAAAGANTQVQYNNSGTLGASANLTFDGTNLGLAGGTASGVAYLNGSKVLTTGSALTFDGSTFKVSTANSSYIGLINGTTKGVRFGADTTGSSIEGVDNTGIASYQPLTFGGSYLSYAISGSEQMRLTSTGLGIGTSSPNASAILDAQSTTKGVRMPNMTTTQKNAISSPAAGLMVFDTTLSKLCVYTGAAWQTITSV